METKETRNGRRLRTIPHEIVFDILTRLAVKSLSRFRCVSKLWNSTISDPHFVKSHHNRSLTRSDGTTLLITFPIENNSLRLTLISANHHHENEYENENENENEDSSSVTVTVNLPITSYISESLNGLILLKMDSQLSICNPSTREFIALPTTTTIPETYYASLHFSSEQFGYDPIDNQHKVLKSLVTLGDGLHLCEFIMENSVFVLGANMWRRIGDCGGRSHIPKGNSVCVNGIIYYRATIMSGLPGRSVLVAFDVRLETFRFIQIGALRFFENASVLIPFEGHLAVINYRILTHGNKVDIWVLEDALQPSLIKKSIVFSSTWRTDIPENLEFKFAGYSHTGEIIMASRSLSKPFYLFYLDLKNVSVRTVKIHGLPDNVFRFNVCGHVESILSLTKKAI